MKVIAFLTEPASYTIDLVEKVFLPNQISYKFLLNSSYTKKESDEISSLNDLSILNRFKTIKNEVLNLFKHRYVANNF